MKINIPDGKRKLVAQLIDPDKAGKEYLEKSVCNAENAHVDLFLAGGSLTAVDTGQMIRQLKQLSNIPVVLFPGSLTQLSTDADAIFLLSLISGRNPELLIGNHVIAAPFLKKIRDRLIPVGYILIDCGGSTSVQYMSQTTPVPAGKTDIAVATALAGEMLGMKAIYLEGGSGAPVPVDAEMIRAVREEISIPLITGGGINSAEKADMAFSAGADMIVVGNGAENDHDLIREVCRIRDNHNRHTAIV